MGDKSETVLARIEKEAPRRNLPIIGRVRGSLLEAVVKQQAPMRALEVGTLVGFSAILISRLLPTGGRLVCVEKDSSLAVEARDNIEEAGLSDRVTVREGDALRVLPELDGSLDLVFLDAAKTEYRAYLSLVESRLHKGSVVVADNTKRFAEEMSDYLDYVRSSHRFKSAYREDAQGRDAVEVSVRL